jgi:hypothetical protein
MEGAFMTTTMWNGSSEPTANEALARHARVRERVAGILYVRNRLEGETLALRAQVAAAREGSALAAEFRAQLARSERELADVRAQAEEAKASLVAVLGAMRAARRDRLHALAGDLATAESAERELESDAVDRRFNVLGLR